MTSRPLERSDSRDDFDCGDPSFNDFLRRYAGQNQFRNYVGVTYVVVDEQRVVCAYATVSASSLDLSALPEDDRRGLPDYPLPVLRLARLAVDLRHQGRGLGRALVRDMMLLALEQRRRVGCVGLLVDALVNRVSFYEQLGFVALDTVSGGAGSRTRYRTMFLSIGMIERATGA